MRQVRLLRALAAVAVLVGAAVTANAGTVYVGAGRAYTTVEAGYAAAAAGDTIVIDDGLYTLSGTLFVGKELTFQAANVGGAVISGGNLTGDDDAVFRLGADATFIGLHLKDATHGLYQRDAGVHGRGERLIITHVNQAVAINNSADRGGSFDIVHATIVGVAAAAAINDGGFITITNSIIADATYAYVAHNNIIINPSHNLLHNVGTVAQSSETASIFSDPNQIIADPLFVDVALGNYRLRPGSPAIDSGVPTGEPFAGAGPDRGAYESTDPVAAVPEPSSLALVVVGVGAVVGARLRRRRVAPRSA